MMGDRQVTVNTGAETMLSEDVVEAFRASLRGQLLRTGEDGYEEVRKVFNGMINRRPALIVRCAGTADVISCVNFVRTNNLLVAVCDGGLIVDLSRMKSIHVDPVRRTARAEPGLSWGEFDHETQVFGLATTGGQMSTTGIAGLTLGAG
jgi:FAD/FMN-containing dehydrogenase